MAVGTSSKLSADAATLAAFCASASAATGSPDALVVALMSVRTGGFSPAQRQSRRGHEAQLTGG